VLKVERGTADKRSTVNTIAATPRRMSRVALIGIAALVAAFAVLVAVRSGMLNGSTSAPTATPVTPAHPANRTPPTTPAKPRVVLLPNLPAQIAHKLRYSRVVVVSLYANATDRATVGHVRVGARKSGAGFTAISLTDEKNARSISAFAGDASSPSVLVVKRPGEIVNRFPGTVDAVVISQAAHNAGARR
jgi:hypothetical protein